MEIESFEMEGIADDWFVVQVSDTTMMPWKTDAGLLMESLAEGAEDAEKKNALLLHFFNCQNCLLQKV